MRVLDLVETAHPDLGKLGVFWHTQGAGKSYSMAFFAEKVRREISAKYTFLLMTDRNDLDSQIYRTFVGAGVANDKTPRAKTGADLKRRTANGWTWSRRSRTRTILSASPSSAPCG
jgi:type I restriction enzyme R subunit